MNSYPKQPLYFQVGDKVIYKYTFFPDDPVNGIDTVYEILEHGCLCVKPNGDFYTAHNSMLTLVKIGMDWGRGES